MTKTMPPWLAPLAPTLLAALPALAAATTALMTQSHAITLNTTLTVVASQ
jgi:hypothetical protein